MRIIYAEPGEVINVRLVHPDFDKTSKGWNEQVRPRSVMLRVMGPDTIQVADFAVRLEPWSRRD